MKFIVLDVTVILNLLRDREILVRTQKKFIQANSSKYFKVSKNSPVLSRKEIAISMKDNNDFIASDINSNIFSHFKMLQSI